MTDTSVNEKPLTVEELRLDELDEVECNVYPVPCPNAPTWMLIGDCGCGWRDFACDPCHKKADSWMRRGAVQCVHCGNESAPEWRRL